MPPRTLNRALKTLGAQQAPGPYSHRVESACDAATAEVIELFGAELGNKSKAIRRLLELGAAALAEERA